ncbi:synaptotagmin-like protein 1 [Rhinophrynus dorsalis]
METARLIDLSFLTSEEQAVIKNVLNRDSKLKKSEEKRIRKIKKNNFDPGCLKLLTGEWFEELKSKRYLQYSSATDLLQYAFEQEKRGGSSLRFSPRLLRNRTFQLWMSICGPSAPLRYGFRDPCKGPRNAIRDTQTIDCYQLRFSRFLRRVNPVVYVLKLLSR